MEAEGEWIDATARPGESIGKRGSECFVDDNRNNNRQGRNAQRKTQVNALRMKDEMRCNSQISS